MDFRADALRADIAHDIHVLEEMLALVAPITPEQDAKLQTLKAWLDRPPLCDGKRLIFTQYADTARYLYDQLDPEDNRPEIEVIYSSSKSKADVVGRFAPRANPQHRPPEGTPEIETLVATDVLSEGLNLQDCDCVVNYDLHWNPVRLIQRFGRIDRIGSTHDVIYGYNFLPETALDENLGLRERLARRIAEIHETIGEDAAILDPSERLNEEAMYAIYTGADLGRYEDDEVDEYLDWNEEEEIIRQLEQDEPELYRRVANLRDGVRCGQQRDVQGTAVFCRAGDYRQLYLLDERGEVASREIPRILRLLKCEPDTPAAPLPEDHNRTVMQLKKQFDQEVQARRAERKHTVSHTRAQRYVLRELRALYDATEGEDLQRQITVLEAAFREQITRPAVRTELNRLQREGLTGMALLEQLSTAYRVYGLDEVRARPEVSERENDALPRIVCSEALVE